MQPESEPGAETAEKLGIIEESVRAWQSPDQQMRSLPAELAHIIAAQTCYNLPPPGPPSTIFERPSIFETLPNHRWPKKARCGACFAYVAPKSFGMCTHCSKRAYYFCGCDGSSDTYGAYIRRECIWCQVEPRNSMAIALSSGFYAMDHIADVIRHQSRTTCMLYDCQRTKQLLDGLEFPHTEYRQTSKLLDSTDATKAPVVLVVGWSFCGGDEHIRACASLAKERNILIKGCRQCGGN